MINDGGRRPEAEKQKANPYPSSRGVLERDEQVRHDVVDLFIGSLTFDNFIE